MADLSFRYARADLLKALADRRGLSTAALVRSLCDIALSAEGFPIGEQQYCLVRNGELISTGFKPSKDEDGGVWLPVENEDLRLEGDPPFDPALHWRLKPLPLRLDGERVVRVYPIVPKTSKVHA